MEDTEKVVWIIFTIVIWIRFVFQFFVFIPRVLSNARRVDRTLLLKFVPHIITITSAAIGGLVKLVEPWRTVENDVLLVSFFIHYFAFAFFYIAIMFRRSAQYLHKKCRQLVIEQQVENVHISPHFQLRMEPYIFLVLVLETITTLSFMQILTPEETVNLVLCVLIPAPLISIFQVHYICKPLRRVFLSFKSQMQGMNTDFYEKKVKRALRNIDAMQGGVTFNCSFASIAAAFCLFIQVDRNLMLPIVTGVHSTMELIIQISVKRGRHSNTASSRIGPRKTAPTDMSSQNRASLANTYQSCEGSYTK